MHRLPHWGDPHRPFIVKAIGCDAVSTSLVLSSPIICVSQATVRPQMSPEMGEWNARGCLQRPQPPHTFECATRHQSHRSVILGTVSEGESVPVCYECHKGDSGEESGRWLGVRKPTPDFRRCLWEVANGGNQSPLAAGRRRHIVGGHRMKLRR
jgi:hypothetical protein